MVGRLSRPRAHRAPAAAAAVLMEMGSEGSSRSGLDPSTGPFVLSGETKNSHRAGSLDEPHSVAVEWSG